MHGQNHIKFTSNTSLSYITWFSKGKTHLCLEELFFYYIEHQSEYALRKEKKLISNIQIRELDTLFPYKFYRHQVFRSHGSLNCKSWTIPLLCISATSGRLNILSLPSSRK